MEQRVKKALRAKIKVGCENKGEKKEVGALAEWREKVGKKGGRTRSGEGFAL